MNAANAGPDFQAFRPRRRMRTAAGSDRTAADRPLGREGGAGADLGLDAEWAARAIAAAGSCAEIFERCVGADSRLGLERGRNALSRDGGLVYSLSFP